MPTIPRINWGNEPTWTDVSDYLAANPPPPAMDWGRFWLDPGYALGVIGDKIVTPLIDSTDAAVKGVVTGAAGTVTTVVGDVADRATAEAGEAFGSAWSRAAPWLAAGTAIWLAAQVMKARQ